MTDSRTLGIFLVMLALQTVVTGLKARLFCVGRDFELQCPISSVLMIRMTSVSLLPMDSKFCHGNNNNVSSCDVLDYSKTLKTNCNGRSNCTVKRNGMNSRHRECKKVFIIAVLFDCEKFKSNASTQMRPTSILTTISKTFTRNNLITRPRTGVETNISSDGSQMHGMTRTFFTLLSLEMALKFSQDRPKHVILCLVLSVSAGIVLLISAILLMVCVERFIEERKKQKETNEIEISLPLLLATPNQPPSTAIVASATPSEAGSSHREAGTQRLQTVRRWSHSVDEGTQTDAGLDEPLVDEHGISDSEARELGYLVDIMKYYNSNLDTMSAVDGHVTDKSETVNTRPRVVDLNRSRQARLSSATYSSSNNSVFAESLTPKGNHVDAAPFSSHNRYRATPRYNSFGHKTNTLGHNHISTNSVHNSTNLENGPRRLPARSRAGYPSAVSDRVSVRPYGTLS